MFTSINNNLLAANSSREVNRHYSELAKSTQRLSSGLRINSAADDAAGLAIRELMRTDVAALNQGVRNANDAISMLQTFDGALGVIDEKLIRMKELAEQAATGTYDSTQRLMIDSEFQAMGEEIDRIANTTEFNGIKLLNYKAVPKDNLEEPYSITKTVDYTIDGIVKLDDIDLDNFDKSDLINGEHTIQIKSERPYIQATAADGRTYNILGRGYPNDGWMLPIWEYHDGKLIQQNYGGLYTFGNMITSDPAIGLFDFDCLQGGQLYVGHLELQIFDEFMNPISSIPEGLRFEYRTIHPQKTLYIDNIKTDITVNYDLSSKKKSMILNSSRGEIKLYFDFPDGGSRWNEASPDNYFQEINIKITENRKDDLPENIVKIHFGTMNDAAEDYYYINKTDATLDGLGLADVKIQTQEEAQGALTKIDSAITEKDKIRAYYGTMQNRLENTVSNLTTQAENLQAAESRISDADIATEMTTFVRNQILTQSAVAMLSQANSLPQMVMQLIR